MGTHKDRCDDCCKVTPIALLDAVLKDDEGSDTTGKLYCETCWPKHQIVATDKWRRGDAEAATP